MRRNNGFGYLCLILMVILGCGDVKRINPFDPSGTCYMPFPITASFVTVDTGLIQIRWRPPLAYLGDSFRVFRTDSMIGPSCPAVFREIIRTVDTQYAEPHHFRISDTLSRRLCYNICTPFDHISFSLSDTLEVRFFCARREQIKDNCLHLYLDSLRNAQGYLISRIWSNGTSDSTMIAESPPFSWQIPVDSNDLNSFIVLRVEPYTPPPSYVTYFCAWLDSSAWTSDTSLTSGVSVP